MRCLYCQSQDALAETLKQVEQQRKRAELARAELSKVAEALLAQEEESAQLRERVRALERERDEARGLYDACMRGREADRRWRAAGTDALMARVQTLEAALRDIERNLLAIKHLPRGRPAPTVRQSQRLAHDGITRIAAALEGRSSTSRCKHGIRNDLPGYVPECCALTSPPEPTP